MRRIALALAVALLSTSAFAQASFTFKDSAGVTQTEKSFNCSSTICHLSVLADSTGTEVGTTGNPLKTNFTNTTLATTVVQLGEVQANPTANTVLDRLKTLNTTLGSPLQAGGTVIANLGTVGGLATAASIGEVQGSPTVNTVLDRLKTLNTTLGTPMQATGGTITTVPSATGGWTPILASALTNSAVTVDASAGTLGYYFCWNPAAAVTYIQIYDIAGAVTVGTSVPKMSLGIPPTASGNLEWSQGVHFANAIKVAATTTAGGGTAPATAADCNFGFK